MALVAFSLQRETAHVTMPPTMQRPATQELVSPPPLTADEEAFAEALWPLHQQMVETSAGRLSFAGLTYAINGHDAEQLVQKLTSLRQTFHEAEAKVAAISVPPSMQSIRDRYIQMLGLYELSATEMQEVTRDGDNRHLIDAQRKSEHAAEELVKVGDILWPGEHKPN